MAQLVKCLLCKSEVPSSNPQHPLEKLSMMVCTFNPSPGEAGKQDLEAR